jgi:uncharacterized protein YndB with AHSA1/START domain
MAPATATAADSASTTLIMTRRFDAPPERVFNAWLDPKQLAQWMGPRGVQAEATRLDARVGGGYAITMHTPDKSNPQVNGTYKEITRYTRLVFTWVWTGDMQETLVTLTFKAVGKATEMTLEHTGFPNSDRRDRHNDGWTGSFDKLADLLAA